MDTVKVCPLSAKQAPYWSLTIFQKYPFMTYFITQLDQLSRAEMDDVRNAPEFVLEAEIHNRLVSIEDAEANGRLVVHVGRVGKLPRRWLFQDVTFAEGAALTLAALKKINPRARMWLSCAQGRAEIIGPDPLRGAIKARASMNANATQFSAWPAVADFIEECDARKQKIDFDTGFTNVLWEIERYLE